MNLYFKSTLTFILFHFFLGNVALNAQESDEIEEESECVRTLNRSQKDFDAGLLEKIAQSLKPCLETGQMSKEEKQQGYRLLTLAYLYDGKDAEAEQAMLEFLKLDPEYKLQPGIDPKEFSELYENYHTSPLYTVGIYAGANWARPQSYKENGSYNTVSDGKKYSSNTGFHVLLRGTRYIYKGLNVHLDLGYMQSSFTYTHNILESYTNVNPAPVDSPTVTTKNPTKGVSIESIESQSALTIPVSLSYTFLLQKNIRPYVIAGLEMRYLLGASNAITKNYLDQNIASVEVADVPGFKERRNDLTFSGVLGIGGKYKIPRGDIFLEAKYNIGISDQVKENVVDVNDDILIWNFYEKDNKFTLDNLNISVGYNYYLYKPRKMKHQKAQLNEKQMKAEEEKQKKAEEEKLKQEEKAKKKEKAEGNGPTEQRQVIE